LVLLFASQCQAQVAGIYWWTWTSGKPNYPTNTNLGVCFSGWANPMTGLNECRSIQPSLPGTKYFDIGGGNDNGNWTSSILSTVINCINNGTFNGYQGICFDVEQGNSGLATQFETAFKTAKLAGFQVLVTISGSAPYGISDAKTLMNSFFQSTNIDYMSPQVYGTGCGNDYWETGGVTWNDYKNMNAKMVPSVLCSSSYAAAQSYYKNNYNITTYGYIQWNN